MVPMKFGSFFRREEEQADDGSSSSSSSSSSPLEKVGTVLRPFKRSFQFWTRATDIYIGYKAFQFRMQFEKDRDKKDEMWEGQHELAADKIYSMCYDLGGFFLKIAQIVGKPDLAPAAWVRRLVTLCDQAPATPFEVVRDVLEGELGKNLEDIFEKFDPKPVGSASIAQVHRARLRRGKADVAIKVQHPGVQELMMTDIRNLRAFCVFLQKTDVNFDLVSITTEIEKQVGYEFDFRREAEAMQRIHHFLSTNNKKVPVLVPRVIPQFSTRRVLSMEFIEGIPILKLGDEMKKHGIDPGGKMAGVAKQKLMNSLSLAYGQMILKSGFFHADPHPGNILICKDSEVALLDYGQVKKIPETLRLAYANLTLAVTDNDPSRAVQSLQDLGIQIVVNCENGPKELLHLSKTMFDTKLLPGLKTMTPFSEDSSLKKLTVQTFPEELFFVLRTVNLLRGLSVGMGMNFSIMEQWKPIAEEALVAAGRREGRSKVGLFGRIFRRKR